jgi:hypothetical protein
VTRIERITKFCCPDSILDRTCPVTRPNDTQKWPRISGKDYGGGYEYEVPWPKVNQVPTMANGAIREK